ncbi:MAG: hypothetical protein IT447_11515 [Phycisphaerales bacterium]|nr:hypothetical protein [Phycisphaerales bacterium]
MSLRWKPDWLEVRQRYMKWWKHEGLVLQVQAPADRPMENLERPVPPATLEQCWLDPVYRIKKAEYDLSRLFLGGDNIPFLELHLGPGNLATFLGSEPGYMPDTIWFEPCMSDIETAPPLRFDPANRHFQSQLALLREGMRINNGRFLVAVPDLIENIDTLASLRGPQELMIDMLEQPDVIKQRLAEVNQVYVQAFDAIHQVVKDDLGGNVFSMFCIWGPGKTAKVQCDASAMISTGMFAEFVIPALRQQCQWLDWSMFHLDGTQCLQHLDHLLAIDELDAIQWTPQAGTEPNGSSTWYPVYRKILEGGKSVQAMIIDAQYVLPLLENVGAKGMFIIAKADSEQEALELLAATEKYRRS